MLHEAVWNSREPLKLSITPELVHRMMCRKFLNIFKATESDSTSLMNIVKNVVDLFQIHSRNKVVVYALLNRIIKDNL